VVASNWSNDMKLSVVMPVYNERNTVREVVERVLAVPFHKLSRISHSPLVVNAKVSSVFCSISCAFADPVEGLALAERFTDSTGRSPAM